MNLASPLQPTSVRRTLRDATSEAHASLDRDLAAALNDRAGYVAFLQGSHRAVTGIEEALARFGVVASSDRAARIEDDLVSLGEAIPASVASPWSPTNLAEAFGSAYVVEGSALGGVVLARMIEQRLGIDATRYLRLRGDEGTPLAWRAFLARLEAWAEAATANEREAASVGARATFASYRAAFVSMGVIERSRG